MNANNTPALSAADTAAALSALSAAVPAAALSAAVPAADTAAALSALSAAVPAAALSAAVPAAALSAAVPAADTAAALSAAVPADTADDKPARNSYKLTDSNKYARLSFVGACWYYAKTIEDFAALYKDTDMAITSATYAVKERKNGTAYVEVVLVPANLPSKGIHITTNTTASLDYRKIAASYANKWAKLAAKNAANNTPEKRAAAAKSKAESSARRAARAYLRSLLKHGFDETAANNEANRYLSSQLEQINAAA